MEIVKRTGECLQGGTLAMDDPVDIVPAPSGRARSGCVSTLMRIQSAIENAGIRFLDNDAGGGIGVRLSEQEKS